MTMIKISDCFHCIIIIVMLCNEIARHDLQVDKVIMASSLKKTALSVFNRKGHNSSTKGSQETPLTPTMSGKRRRDAVSESSITERIRSIL